MSVYQRALITQQQNYYRNYYRRFVMATLISICFSFILVLMMLFVHLTRAPTTFYASNTAGFIMRLNPLAEPNATNDYLLPPDPPETINANKLNLEQ